MISYMPQDLSHGDGIVKFKLIISFVLLPVYGEFPPTSTFGVGSKHLGRPWPPRPLPLPPLHPPLPPHHHHCPPPQALASLCPASLHSRLALCLRNKKSPASQLPTLPKEIDSLCMYRKSSATNETRCLDSHYSSSFFPQVPSFLLSQEFVCTSFALVVSITLPSSLIICILRALTKGFAPSWVETEEREREMRKKEWNVKEVLLLLPVECLPCRQCCLVRR